MFTDQQTRRYFRAEETCGSVGIPGRTAQGSRPRIYCGSGLGLADLRCSDYSVPDGKTGLKTETQGWFHT